MFVPTVGASLFGVAAVVLGLDGFDLLVQGASHGAGGQLSGAIVSGIVAAGFAWRLLRVLGARAERQRGAIVA